jgi:choline dehydrogenase
VAEDRPAFDYVIVGAGSAGCVLANRLSEDGKATICVLEAGRSDWHPYVHIPAGFMKMLDHPGLNWCYKTVASESTGGREMLYPRGKVVGGSSSINGHLYVRGQPLDYDSWAQRGNRGWGYDDVLPYFRRSEERQGGDEQFRGRNGMLHVSDVHEKHPLCEAYIAGVTGTGVPLNPDYNGATQEGVGYYQRTIRKGRRLSAARAFLKPALKRPGVELITEAHVLRVILEGRRAVGVRYRKGGDEREIRANREVILSGGAINSPQLLQLSGVGPGALLQDLGIPVVHELAGVGEGFRDHYLNRISVRARSIRTLNERAHGWRLGVEVARWLATRQGILAFSPAHVGVFIRTSDHLEHPDFQLTFTPASYEAGIMGQLESEPGMTGGGWMMRPESTGYVRARSPDPMTPPAIHPNYLDDPLDKQTHIAGMRRQRAFLRQPVLARFFEREVMPGDEVQSDDEWLDYARREGATVYHAIGSCRMGPDPMAVVDDRLRVRGLEALRVVDASVMPTMPSANTNAATYMVAEKASDMIQEDGRAVS